MTFTKYHIIELFYAGLIHPKNLGREWAKKEGHEDVKEIERVAQSFSSGLGTKIKNQTLSPKSREVEFFYQKLNELI